VVEGLNCPALTDASVTALAEHSKHLRRICLVHSPQVTEVALTKLQQIASAASACKQYGCSCREACANYILLTVNAPDRHDTVSDDFEDLGDLGGGGDGEGNDADTVGDDGEEWVAGEDP
jgi:hypothetical protein